MTDKDALDDAPIEERYRDQMNAIARKSGAVSAGVWFLAYLGLMWVIYCILFFFGGGL